MTESPTLPALTVDCACPADYFAVNYSTWLRGGVNVCVVSAASTHTARQTLSNLAAIAKFVAAVQELCFARELEDIARAASDRRLAIILHLQGTHALEYEPDLLYAYREAGIRIVQLGYNQRNPLFDGCDEPDDGGMSKLGRQTIALLDQLGFVVDLSHTSERTCLQALEQATCPRIFSHSNLRAVHDSPRNISDTVLRELAACGGVIGINGFPSFVSKNTKPTLDDFIDHIAYVCEAAGPDYVGLGLDYWFADPPLATYQQLVLSGAWNAEFYPPPPYAYPQGLETAEGFPALRQRLHERGFQPTEVDRIMGGNFLRVFASVWAGRT
jgi:membrane dipeptidase